MTEIKSGRICKKKKSIAPTAICAAICSLICAVSLIMFSGRSNALPTNAQNDMLPAFYSSGQEENSFWESYAQFTAHLFFQ